MNIDTKVGMGRSELGDGWIVFFFPRFGGKVGALKTRRAKI